jgi:hypothetical protein
MESTQAVVRPVPDPAGPAATPPPTAAADCRDWVAQPSPSRVETRRAGESSGSRSRSAPRIAWVTRYASAAQPRGHRPSRRRRRPPRSEHDDHLHTAAGAPAPGSMSPERASTRRDVSNHDAPVNGSLEDRVPDRGGGGRGASRCGKGGSSRKRSGVRGAQRAGVAAARAGQAPTVRPITVRPADAVAWAPTTHRFSTFAPTTSPTVR